MKRKSVRVLGLVVAVAGATACGGDEPTGGSSGGGGEAVKIGLVTDVSGRFVSVGKDLEAATKQAVEEVNRRGDAELELEVVDSGGEPAQAVVAYRQLRDNGAAAVLGPLSSPEAEVVFEQAKGLRVPVISGTANKDGITEGGAGWAFINTATNGELYANTLPKWQEANQVKSAVVVYDSQEPVSTAAATKILPAISAKTGLRLAGKPLTFTRGQTDFSTLVERIRQADVDGLIVLSAPTEGGLIAKELGRQGEDRPVLGAPSQASASFFAGGGEAIDDWTLPSIFPAVPQEADGKAYLEQIRKNRGEETIIPEAANYYDAVTMLGKVIADGKAAGGDPDAAREAIRTGLTALKDFDGVAGMTTFGGKTDAQKTLYVNVVRAGKLENAGE